MRNSRLGFSAATVRLDRWMLFVSLPLTQDGLEGKRAANRRVANAQDQINKDLVRLAQEITIKADKPIKPARVLLLPGRTREGHIADYLSEHPSEMACMIRAFISVGTVPDDRPSTISGLSHLVQIEIEPNQQRRGWYAGGSVAQAVVRASEEDWPLVVEDVLLDVCMSRCYPNPPLNLAIASHDLSTRKVAHVAALGKPSFYGRLHEEPRYVSLASFSRGGSVAFDAEAYVALWASMLADKADASRVFQREELAQPAPIKFIVPGQKIRDSIPAKEQSAEIVQSVVADILQQHKKGNQISRRKLASLIRVLKPGSYFLMRAEKKPRRKLAAIQLSYFLGKGRWKTGRLAVFEARDLQRYWPYQPYISIYRFEVPEPDAVK